MSQSAHYIHTDYVIRDDCIFDLQHVSVTEWASAWHWIWKWLRISCRGNQCERLSELENLGKWVSHIVSEFATVETKRSYCILANAHSDKWYIHTFNPIHPHPHPPPPSAACIGQWIAWALVQILAYRLFGAKPVSKPMLFYCQLDPYEQTSVYF